VALSVAAAAAFGQPTSQLTTTPHPTSSEPAHRAEQLFPVLFLCGCHGAWDGGLLKLPQDLHKV